MAALIAQLLPIALERVARGDAGDPQDATAATAAGFFEDAYAHVDWRSPARQIHDQVRAWRFAAIAGVRGPIADLDGRRLRLVKTRLDARAGGIRVECGDGPAVGARVGGAQCRMINLGASAALLGRPARLRSRLNHEPQSA